MRGAEFTLHTEDGGSSWRLHVIEGTGSVHGPNGEKTVVAAGQTLSVTPTGTRVSLAWPSADRALVPAAELPPAITALRFSGGGSAHATFRLNRAAKIVFRVLLRRRVVQHRKFSGKKGLNTVGLGALSRGQYLLLVKAIDSAGRTALAERSAALS